MKMLKGSKVVVGRMVLCLALVSSAALAQEPACSLYKVNTSLLNISKEAGSDAYIDVLEDGEIACVTRRLNVDGRDWGYISHKLEKPNGRKPVDGWSVLGYMKELSPAEASDLGTGAPPPGAAAPSAPAAGAAAQPVSAAAPAAGLAPAPIAIRPEDILRFDQPIPFGPFPVQGHSIKELIEGEPLFSPIEGLEESIWKKKCTSCHKWTQERLCEQGKTYVKSPRNSLRIPHPYGGPEKVALMRWVKSGCE
jgi:hypothetical protein